MDDAQRLALSDEDSVCEDEHNNSSQDASASSAYSAVPSVDRTGPGADDAKDDCAELSDGSDWSHISAGRSKMPLFSENIVPTQNNRCARVGSAVCARKRGRHARTLTAPCCIFLSQPHVAGSKI